MGGALKKFMLQQIQEMSSSLTTLLTLYSEATPPAGGDTVCSTVTFTQDVNDATLHQNFCVSVCISGVRRCLKFVQFCVTEHSAKTSSYIVLKKRTKSSRSSSALTDYSPALSLPLNQSPALSSLSQRLLWIQLMKTLADRHF